MAVLPFENLGDTEDAYSAAGVTDEVRSKLTELPLSRSSRAPARAERGHDSPTREIASELGVHYLPTPTFRWAKRGRRASRVG